MSLAVERDASQVEIVELPTKATPKDVSETTAVFRRLDKLRPRGLLGPLGQTHKHKAIERTSRCRCHVMSCSACSQPIMKPGVASHILKWPRANPSYQVIPWRHGT